MATVQIADVIVPAEFTQYIVENAVEKTAFYESGVVRRHDQIADQLRAGADEFTIPYWLDLGNPEADVVTDNPATQATPEKVGSGQQRVRKSFLHKGWSAMNLASELSGSDALTRIKERVAAYWARQWQRRLISSLTGILLDNVANDSGDMRVDISALAGALAVFNSNAVIAAGLTLGDQIDAVKAIAVHSTIYGNMLRDDQVEFVPVSEGRLIRTYRGLAIIVDDGLPVASGVYTSVLFGSGAVGFGFTEPRIAAGTEVENLPSSGNGGGQQILHTRFNMAAHPVGFSWLEGSVAGISPTIAELALAANWNRVASTRKHVPVAYLLARSVAV